MTRKKVCTCSVHTQFFKNILNPWLDGPIDVEHMDTETFCNYFSPIEYELPV